MKNDILKKMYFNLFDFNISHKVLTLRASGLDNGEIFNIDIIFKGVFYIETITSIGSIKIEKADETDLKNIENRLSNIILSKGLNLFKMISDDNVFFIAATSYELIKNHLPPLEESR